MIPSSGTPSSRFCFHTTTMLFTSLRPNRTLRTPPTLLLNCGCLRRSSQLPQLSQLSQPPQLEKKTASTVLKISILFEKAYSRIPCLLSLAVYIHFCSTVNLIFWLLLLLGRYIYIYIKSQLYKSFSINKKKCVRIYAVNYAQYYLISAARQGRGYAPISDICIPWYGISTVQGRQIT